MSTLKSCRTCHCLFDPYAHRDLLRGPARECQACLHKRGQPVVVDTRQTRMDAIQGRADAATRGPWEADKWGLYIFAPSGMIADSHADGDEGDPITEDKVVLGRVRGVGSNQPREANMAFIAHCREDMTWVLDQLAKSMAEVEKLQQRLRIADLEQTC